ncbi:MAG: peptide deformylase [Owenweeksia sp.]
MILPIVAYGDPVLRKKGEDIDKDYPGLQELIDNMFETMYNASGVGLAAPQIGRPIRLFVIDTTSFVEEGEEDEEELKDFREVFINAQIVEEEGEEWAFNEGCLSIPDVREDVNRQEQIRIEYYDRDFNKQEKVFEGLKARVIQHEYDHIEGILFTDHLSPLRKRILKSRLNNISKGKLNVGYKMRFPKI